MGDTELHHLPNQFRLHPYYIIVQLEINGFWLNALLIKCVDTLIPVYNSVWLPHQIDHRIKCCHTLEKLNVCSVVSIYPYIVTVNNIRTYNKRNKVLHITATASSCVDYYLIIFIHLN